MEPTQQPTVAFAQLISRGCGLDVHKDVLVATIRGEGLSIQTRSFGAFTQDIEALADWLRQQQVTHVAMESTGVYWKPVFNSLGQEFEVLLVNARHIKNVPTRKRDKKDSEWLAQLLLAGLLSASFIPPQQVREWRDLFPYQRKATGHVASEWNHIQKVLEDANIKLASVLSDVSGVSGRRMLEALSQGQTDVDALLKLAHGRLKPKGEELKKALLGRGKKRALVAIGHKILVSAYQVLKSGQKYVDLGKDYLAKRQERSQLQSALGKLHALGY